MAQERIHRLAMPSFGDGDWVFSDAVAQPQQVHDRLRMKINKVPARERSEDRSPDDLQSGSGIVDVLPADQSYQPREEPHPDASSQRGPRVVMGLDITRPDTHIPAGAKVFVVESFDLLRIVLAIGIESDQ